MESLLKGDGVFRPDNDSESGSDNVTKSSVPSSGKNEKEDASKGYEGDLNPQPEG